MSRCGGVIPCASPILYFLNHPLRKLRLNLNCRQTTREHGTPRKSRLPLLFKRKNKPPLPASQATSPQPPPTAAAIPSGGAEDYGDRDRALARYKEAAELLKES